MNSIAEQTVSNTKTSQSAREGDYANDFLKLVLEALEDSKAEDVVSIDLEGKSALGDYMVIASGTSTRHVSSIAEKLVSKLKETGYGLSRVEGLRNADWVLIDASDIIIHLFRPEVRDFYNLEKIWTHNEAETEGS